MPRTSSKMGKDAVSVYKHMTTKGEHLIFSDLESATTIIIFTVPSQLAIYQKMLSDDKLFASTMVPRDKVARFMDEGLKIQDAQCVIHRSSLIFQFNAVFQTHTPSIG